MNITVEDAGTCLKKINVEVPVTLIKQKLDENYKQLSRQVQLPGFRPGKAPRNALEKKYGDYVRKDVRQQLLEQAVQEAAKQHSLDLLGNPEVDTVPELATDTPLSFAMTVEVRPVFDLPEYKAVAIESTEPEVADKELHIFLRNIQFSKGQLHDLKSGEASKNGDVIFGDFNILVDGEQVAGRDGGSIEVGSDTILGVPVAEAVKKLESLKGSETLEFDVTIPGDFPLEKYRAKKAKISIKVSGVKRPEIPELTDALAKELEFDSLDAMRDYAKDVILSEKRQQQQQDLESRLLEGIAANVKLEIPPKLAERQLSSVLQREAFQKYQQGVAEAEIEKFVEQRRKELPKTIEEQIKRSLVIDAIAKKERVFVTEDELARHVTAIAQSRGVAPQELANKFHEAGMFPQIRWELKAQKVRTFLRQKAKVTYKDAKGNVIERKEPPKKAPVASATAAAPAVHIPHGQPGHVHGPDCGHDHGHAHHQNPAHGQKGHVHGPDCDHGHDHSHDHGHAGQHTHHHDTAHDHSHDVGHERRK